MTKTNRFIGRLIAAGTLWLCTTLAGADNNVPLRIATFDHPHVRAIQDGSIAIKGCTVEFSTQSWEALANDLSTAHHADVLEVELLPYLEKKSAGGLPDYTLVPIFLKRAFQLRYVYVRTDRAIRHPQDLRGKKVGVSGYARTLPTWVRGILQSSWSVKPEEMSWVDTEASTSSTKSLSQLIEQGEVDAIISLDTPGGFGGNRADIVRLFPDFKATEQDIFLETRIFPIVTALAVRKNLVEKNAWLPEALFNAFSESKKKAYATGVMPLPWEGTDEKATQKILGKNYWSYGVKSNPKTLRALFHYAESQGLLHKKLAPADVFDPSTMLLMEP